MVFFQSDINQKVEDMLKHLILKEFIQMKRNAFIPRLVVMFPIMVMCVMPWVMNQEVRDVRVSVVDQDRSTQSSRIVHSVESSRYFVFGGLEPTYVSALQSVERSRTDVVLVIPRGLGRQLAVGERPSVLIAANAVNGTKGSIGSAYLSSIVTSQCSATETALEKRVSTLTIYNNHQNYKVFMIPALLAIVMMMMCGFLPALNIVGEKESGTIEQINVTPVSKWAFILSKLIPYWLIALLVVSVCLVLAWLVYGISCQGPLLLVYLLAMLLALFFSSLGLVVSNYSDTLQQAILVMWFFYSLPDVAQWSIHTSPVYAIVGICDDLCQPNALFHRCG